MADDMLPKNIDSLHPLHTLQTDVAEALAKEHVTQVQIIAEQEKAKTVPKIEIEEIADEDIPSPKISHMIRNFGIAAVCLGIIFASGYGIFTIAKQRSSEPPVEIVETPETNQMLTYDSVKAINFSPEELNDRQALISKLQNDTHADESKMTFFKLNITFPNLISLLSPSIPAEYRRSLIGESFYGGVAEGNFFVMKFDSYEQAYAGQLQWEKTMGNDLLYLLGSTTSLATSTIPARFEDRIIANRDVRVALDAKGNTLFVYGFYRNKTVIFSRTEGIYTSVYEMLLRQNI